MNPTIIAAGDGWAFWQIGQDVCRAPEGAGLDVDGRPMGKRWECARSLWDTFRDAFAWAEDVRA